MLISRGKRIEELTREELEQALRHFHAAHVKSVQDHAKALRRMTKMEEALEPEDIERLDEWLHYFPNDAYKGDGTELWVNWRSYKMVRETNGNQRDGRRKIQGIRKMVRG
jgi:hypothetical protein